MEILGVREWTRQAACLVEAVSGALMRSDGAIRRSLLFIRHSEREHPEEVKDLLGAPLTDEGRSGAFEFGYALPPGISYRVLYSPIERCKETAEAIERGLRAAGAGCEGCREFGELFGIRAGEEEFRGLLLRDSNDIMNHWVSGHYAPWEMEPSLHVAQRIAGMWRRNSPPVVRADPPVDVAVSHDLHTAVCLFHWSGIFRGSENFIDPLDGFFAQETERELIVHTADRSKRLAHPYWWETTGP